MLIPWNLQSDWALHWCFISRKTQWQNLQKWKVRHQHSKDLALSFDFLSFQFRRSISIFIINFHDILVSHAFPSKRILFNVTLKGKALAPLGICNTFEGCYLLIRWVYILQTIFVHLPMYFHPNGNEMNSLLEGVSGFSFTNRQCLFIKVEIHSGLKGNVFDPMKFWKRKYLAGQILGFEKVIHFLTPSHYLFFLTVQYKFKLSSKPVKTFFKSAFLPRLVFVKRSFTCFYSRTDLRPTANHYDYNNYHDDNYRKL